MDGNGVLQTASVQLRKVKSVFPPPCMHWLFCCLSRKERKARKPMEGSGIIIKVEEARKQSKAKFWMFGGEISRKCPQHPCPISRHGRSCGQGIIRTLEKQPEQILRENVYHRESKKELTRTYHYGTRFPPILSKTEQIKQIFGGGKKKGLATDDIPLYLTPPHREIYFLVGIGVPTSPSNHTTPGGTHMHASHVCGGKKKGAHRIPTTR